MSPEASMTRAFDGLASRIDALGERLLDAKRAYLQQRSHDDRLFGNRFAPEG